MQKDIDSAVELTHREPMNCGETTKRPEKERIKWEERAQKEFKDFEKRNEKKL